MFFETDTPPNEFSFTGEWLTEFRPDPTVPVPGLLWLLAGGLGVMVWRKKVA